ncbi:MAG: HAD family hydrolase [Dehalococcoidia bacterium]|nr:HAD family hydrolase [Dehalococcoidia bacterium]
MFDAASMSSTAPYRVSLIVFDVDGTLIDFVGALRVALAAAAEHVSTLTSAPVAPHALQAVMQGMRAELEWRGKPQWEVRLESVRRILVASDVTAPEAVMAVARTYATSRDRALTVYPDVTNALEALRERGFELRAASNGNMDLDVVGLKGFFAATELAEDMGVSKPDPKFYATVVERAGVAPAHVLAVGDRVDNDYEPARAAGLHALLIDRAGALDGTLPRVRALTDVVALVERA